MSVQRLTASDEEQPEQIVSAVDPDQHQRGHARNSITVRWYSCELRITPKARRSTSLKRPVLCYHVQVSVRDIPSLSLGRTIAAWVTMSSTHAQVEINVQCSAAGARWKRIVEKDPRLSLRATADH
jgi:hypothetical protein